MHGKRALVARLLAASSAIAPLGRLRALLRRNLPILAYHRVFELDDEDAFPFDPELVSATPSGFRRQMQYVAQNFDAISFADVLSALDGGQALPARPLIVTFDDGYGDNYEHAFPILRETGVPATIFVATGYIGGSEPFWHDRVAHALYRTLASEVWIPGLEHRLRLGDVSSRRRASWDAVAYLKSLPDEQRRQCLHTLHRQIDLDVREHNLHLCRPMTWHEVAEMSEAGIEFGSHTVTHPVLARLDDEALETELVDSRRELERRLGVAAPVISYPFGGPRDFDERVMTAARAAGYRLAVSYIRGHNDQHIVAPYELLRLHVEHYMSMPTFASMLSISRRFAS